ncbi:MAG: hypothetical protein IJI41_00465 [Anaerolineaceae bacterium]|nr:hypothetical protein [Anaerolineaceae bacterium]
MIGELAIIMSVKEGKAVALAPGGQFLQIKDRNFQVGQRIVLEPSLLSWSDRAAFTFENTKEKFSRLVDRLRYKGLIILTSAAILIPSSAYATTKFVPWTYVSVDNGAVSVQYQLNARGEVLSSESLSDEGQKLIDEIAPVRFEKIENVMDRTFAAVPVDNTAIEPQPFVIGISSRFGSGEETIKNITEKNEEKLPPEFFVEHLDWSDAGKAHKEELSIGQYSLRNNPENKLPITIYAEEFTPESGPEIHSSEGRPAFDGSENAPDNGERPDKPEENSSIHKPKPDSEPAETDQRSAPEQNAAPDKPKDSGSDVPPQGEWQPEPPQGNSAAEEGNPQPWENSAPDAGSQPQQEGSASFETNQQPQRPAQAEPSDMGSFGSQQSPEQGYSQPPSDIGQGPSGGSSGQPGGRR